MKAYHFVASTLRDGRPIPKDGEWLAHEGPVEMCESGLHASEHPFDALKYAPGETLCLVEVDDLWDKADDKLVCRRRKIIARFDATEMLRRFAREQALKVIDKWDAPPVVREYLTTGDEKLRSAAWSAARSAAESAAWSAAWSAVESVAWSAAWSAVESVAWSAAWSAARSAARSAAWSAAGSAAWSAVESVARSAARNDFQKAVTAEFRGMGVQI